MDQFGVPSEVEAEVSPNMVSHHDGVTLDHEGVLHTADLLERDVQVLALFGPLEHDLHAGHGSHEVVPREDPQRRP